MKLQAGKQGVVLSSMIFFYNGTFFCSAAHKESLEVERAGFLGKKPKEQAEWFLNAALRGDIKSMLLAIEEDRSLLNTKDEVYGATALILATELGHFAACKLLLDCGAIVNETDCDVNNALMYSVMSKHADSVDLLKLFLQRGMSVHQKNRFGELPIDIARKGLITNNALLKDPAESVKKKDELLVQDRLVREKIALLEANRD